MFQPTEHCFAMSAADIVTGKLDVRETAARMPELPTDMIAESAADEALAEVLPDDPAPEEVD